ncbi:hypothetical protein CC1G_12672 [Coprinopsis cinerea okayama7|uniref:Uncharacterized protein n=1 Tax=Coprinopsis cinerea (strain Okayama-7 / 130 / ATCC MYA-4618 / FGSC 9003) TaxID=240176 RepID=A8PHL7_COPC7|nr:hypothetical protein CC1G_12672 [Coprinopsis cinerea okayama7\|eukprot:XP_001841432.1 hypothetical protein CC1G_12672 [Coprinopsis cinerea okayama7\
MATNNKDKILLAIDELAVMIALLKDYDKPEHQEKSKESPEARLKRKKDFAEAIHAKVKDLVVLADADSKAIYDDLLAQGLAPTCSI